MYLFVSSSFGGGQDPPLHNIVFIMENLCVCECGVCGVWVCAVWVWVCVCVWVSACVWVCESVSVRVSVCECVC